MATDRQEARAARIREAVEDGDKIYRWERPVDEALYWTEATILQCRRVVAQNEWSQTRVRDWSRHMTDRLEALSLLNAAGKAHRWIADGDLNPPWNPESIRRFSELAAQARSIRNKREHEDEYGAGKKSELLREVTADRTSMTIHAEPNVTVLTGGRVLLGGVVDVHELHDAALTAADELRRAQHRQARSPEFKKKPGMIGP